MPTPEPTEPRRRGRVGFVLAAFTALLAIGAAVLVGVRSYDPPREDPDGVVTDTWHPKYPPQKDVELDDCKIERTGALVGGTVRNPTEGTVRYVIEVHLLDPSGTTITSASVSADAIGPETTSTWSGVLPAVASTAQSATCKITKVNRYAA